MTPTTVTLPTNAPATVVIDAHGRAQQCVVAWTAGGGWVIADIFLTGLIGVVVDGVTGNWNHASPAHCHAMV